MPLALDPSTEHRRSSGSERYIKTVEWNLQALAQSLNIGFLASPAIEEPLSTRFRRQSPPFINLPSGKIVHHDFFGHDIRSTEFQIDPEFAALTESEDRKAMRMREVESNRLIRSLQGEFGFSELAIAEAYLRSGPVQIHCQQPAENTSCGNERVAVTREMKATCAKCFIRGKGSREFSADVRFDLEGRSPNMNLALSQRQLGGQDLPFDRSGHENSVTGWSKSVKLRLAKGAGSKSPATVVECSLPPGIRRSSALVDAL